MMAEPSTLIMPPSDLRFRRRIRLGSIARELWRSRELVRTLAEREIRARYKQAILGFGWAIVTPLALMIVFTLVFQRVARFDTGNVPYPLFTYVGVLTWTFFSVSVSQGGLSLVQNVNLLNKVYCPREVFPIASVTVAAIDTVVALPALGLLFLVMGFAPKLTSFWVPVLLLVQIGFTLGITFVISSIVVYLRDVRHALPLILQLGIFMTPVGYPIEIIPARFHGLYAVLNPLAVVIDGYRRSVLHGLAPRLTLLLLGGTSALVVLVLGYLLFKRLEAGIADVA
jgi:ABC-2 type transport system permease protein/lipopolysaccharide transport system permease protein